MAWKQLLSFLSTDTFAGKGTDLATVINNLTADTQTLGGNLDAAGYLTANMGGAVFLPGALPGTTYTVTAGSWAGGTATLTIGTHTVVARQQVQIASVTPSGYNGTVQITSVTGTTISYLVSSNPGTWTSGGTVTVGATAPVSGQASVDPTFTQKIWNGSAWVAPAAGLGDPGGNGIIKRTALNTTVPATGLDVRVLAGIVSVADYNFAALSPGGSLTTGANTITLSPTPAGLTTSAAIGGYLYISGGSGAAEAVPITAVGSGTVTVTCGNTHPAGWTIQSATVGIQECINANLGLEIRIPLGHYVMHAGLVLNPTKPIILTGDGGSSSSTFMDFAAVTTMPAISMTDSSVTNQEPKIIRNLQLQGTGTSTGNDGVYLSNVVRVIFDNVMVNSFALDGIHTNNAFEISIRNGCQIIYNGAWGIRFDGISSLSRIERSYIGQNSRSNGSGNVFINGTSALAPTDTVTLDGADIEGAGTLPFTSVATAWGLLVQYCSSITVANSFFEGNLTNAIIYQGATANITEYNNWINTTPILYASDTVGARTWGNTFYGTGAYRSIACSLGVMAIGPDHVLNSSPEVTNHPSSFGIPGTTGSGSAALGANSPAVTNTAPYTWLKTLAPDGSTVYIPAWK